MRKTLIEARRKRIQSIVATEIGTSQKYFQN